MKQEEIAKRLSEGGLGLAFDTNAVEGDKKLDALCALVAQHNMRLAGRGLLPIRLVICTVAYHEKLFHLKQRFCDLFAVDLILKGLESKGMEVQSFDAKHALETSVRIGERYPDPAAWHEAKKRRYLLSLGLDPQTDQAQGSGKKCGATVDWLIGGHARAEGCVLVTEDKGMEFFGLVDRVRFETLKGALQQLLSEPA